MPVVGKAWSKQLDRAQMTQSRHSPEALVWGQGRWSGMTLKRASVQFPKSKMSSEKRMIIPYRAIRESFLEEVVSKSGITEKQSWIKHVR